MEIIINKHIPFKGFIAFSFFNIIFWREDQQDKLYRKDILNHESIHMAQMQDFCKFILIGGIVFYIIYGLEWIYRLVTTLDFYAAYASVSFEKEAHENEDDLSYLMYRKHFAQWRG